MHTSSSSEKFQAMQSEINNIKESVYFKNQIDNLISSQV
jgi:hypothetical protein